jgi:hypothetical protein
MKHEKQPELNSRIPYPIKLEEEAQVAFVLKIRQEQLELAIQLGEWTDAHRSAANIYQLMNRIGKKQTDQ